MLYPLKFLPILKERLWGGTRLSSVLGHCFPKKNVAYGESWEISGVEGSVSVVANGYLAGNNLQELTEIYMADLLGDHVYERFGCEFPLLIKFIDANDVLSVQVHPDDVTAARRHHAYGKTEMWYVIDSESDAQLFSGFNRKVTREELLQQLTNGGFAQLLHSEHVAPGDAFFIPAGRVHTIGKGILLAEIQQTSDITYRLHDWNRLDANGQPRELHTQLALDVIDYEPVVNAKIPAQTANEAQLIKCQYFVVNRLLLTKVRECNYDFIDSFVVYICIDGRVQVDCSGADTQTLCTGQCMLVPAEIKHIFLTPMQQSLILEVYLP